jgi:hypothetical protein
MSSSRYQTDRARMTPPRQRLVDLVGEIQFGRIENLQIRGGDPAFDPPPTVIRVLKLSAAGSNSGTPASDQTRRRAFAELFAHFARMRDGTIEKIQIANGLPMFAEIEERARR